MFKRKSKREDGKFPENVLLLFKRAVSKLPFDLTEKQIQSLVKAIERVTLETSERVLVKGSMSPGWYVALSGRVEAISSHGGIPLRFVKKGDFFGDVSTFFGTPCPITVRAYEGTELLFIKSQSILNIMTEKPNISLFQWFVKRKYIDTAKLFQEHAVTKELAYQSLYETPMLHNWSSDCLHFLIEQTSPEIIVLFPTGSYICRQGDHAREIFILVHGTVKLITDKQECVTVSSSNTSFCMGEEAFFNMSTRNGDIKAETPCLVLIINKEHLDHLFYSDILCTEEQDLYESLSQQWKHVHTKQDKGIYSKYSGQLDLEVISILLWQALQQRGIQIPFTAAFFHTLFLSMNAMEIEVGKEILSSEELYDVVLLLLKGCGELFSENMSAGNIQSVGLYLPSSDVPNGSWIKATETSLAIKIPAADVRKAQGQFLDTVIIV